mgnify:CR=1 FL=1
MLSGIVSSGVSVVSSGVSVVSSGFSVPASVSWAAGVSPAAGASVTGFKICSSSSRTKSISLFPKFILSGYSCSVLTKP